MKLTARYPEGAFDVYRSENRAEGDIWFKPVLWWGDT
jgi:hypothetical protein